MAEMLYQHPTNSTSAGDFFLQYTSTITNSLWGYLILIVVFSISYLALSGYNARKAFAAASFSTWTTTVILTNFGVVGGYAFTLTSLMVIASLLLNHHGASRGGDPLV